MQQELQISEIDEYLRESNKKRRLLPYAALVGFYAGVVAVAFNFVLLSLESYRETLSGLLHGQLPKTGWIILSLLGGLGAVSSAGLVKKYAPNAKGSGIPNLELVLKRLTTLNEIPLLLVKFFAGAVAIGTGLTLGREGPSVQMGGAIGSLIGRSPRLSMQDKLTLVSAGAGAGLAAAFNAPLAGLIFVLEELQRDFRPRVFTATFIATLIASIVASYFTGQSPILALPEYQAPELSLLPDFLLLGLLTGIFGVLFNKTLLFSVAFTKGLTPGRKTSLIFLIGALIGLIGWWDADIIGTGHKLLSNTLHLSVTGRAIFAFLLIRFICLMFSYSTGVPGGIFAPMLVLGALFGLGFGHVESILHPVVGSHLALFSIIGMAALFAGSVRAPLTGTILIVEMTGDYNLLLSLLVACFSAYAIAEWFRDIPIYEALLLREEELKQFSSHGQKSTVLELEVSPQSPFVGKKIADLGIPRGCLIIRIVDSGEEIIPTGDTILKEHARITVTFSLSSKDLTEFIYRGCTSAH